MSGPPAGAEGLLPLPGERRRWMLGAALALGLHAGPAAIIAWWPAMPAASNAAPPVAIMLALAPIPVAPVAPPTEQPVGPEQVAAVPPPPPESETVPTPEIEEVPPVAVAAVVLLPRPAPKPPAPRPVAQPVPEFKPDERPPAPETTALAEAPVAPAPVAAAPTPDFSQAASDSVPNWESQLRGQLERHKRYPREAQWRREQGVAHLRFTMDRDGKVLSYRLERSSGVRSLDEETLALIVRAQPLPAPPPRVHGERLEIVVPIAFTIKR